jgi:hypothetical protein
VGIEHLRAEERLAFGRIRVAQGSGGWDTPPMKLLTSVIVAADRKSRQGGTGVEQRTQKPHVRKQRSQGTCHVIDQEEFVRAGLDFVDEAPEADPAPVPERFAHSGRRVQATSPRKPGRPLLCAPATMAWPCGREIGLPLHPKQRATGLGASAPCQARQVPCTQTETFACIKTQRDFAVSWLVEAHELFGKRLAAPATLSRTLRTSDLEPTPYPWLQPIPKPTQVPRTTPQRNRRKSRTSLWTLLKLPKNLCLRSHSFMSMAWQHTRHGTRVASSSTPSVWSP